MKHYCNPMNLEYRFQFLKRPEYGGDNDLYNVSLYDGGFFYQ